MRNKYFKEEYEKNIPHRVKKALNLCSTAADEQNLPIFLIGGIVRDIIIDKKNFDVDITVQGNAVEFAQCLQNNYPGLCRVKETHDSFKTAKILFDIEGDSVALDLASTRKESYPYPSSLPVIEEIGCELYEDVIRRDFTINSMALSLNKDSRYKLVDYLGGYKDLQKGVLKILHQGSFIDDPTRIIRGLKFSVRFGYKYSEKTQKLMQECLDSGRFDNLGGERVKLELKQAFNINRAEVLERFICENIYRLVDTEIIIPKDISKLTAEIQKTVSDYSNFLQKPENTWLIYLGVILVNCVPGKIAHMAENMDLSGEEENIYILKYMTDCCRKKIRDLAERLYLSSQEESILQCASCLCKNQESLRSLQTRFEIYEFFEKAGIESILIFAIRNKDLKDKVDLYLNELKNTKINIDGNTLIKMGLKPGPRFSEILREVLKFKVDKKITTFEEETELVKSLII